MSKNPQKYLEALGIHNLRQALLEYNPWWKTKIFSISGIPDFKRDAFTQARRYTEANHGLALLINGPRRVGKTTIINQIIRCLIEEKKIPANRILFFSLDDPIIQQLPQRDQGILFEALLAQWAQVAGTALRTSPTYSIAFLTKSNVCRVGNCTLNVMLICNILFVLLYPVRLLTLFLESHWKVYSAAWLTSLYPHSLSENLSDSIIQSTAIF